MDRLKSDIWTNGFLRRCQAQGIYTTIAKRGDKDAGLVMLKLFASRDQVEAFIETRNEAGQMAWRSLTKGPVPEGEADAALAKQISFDRDLWIVEVESAKGRTLLEEPIIP